MFGSSFKPLFKRQKNKEEIEKKELQVTTCSNINKQRVLGNKNVGQMTKYDNKVFLSWIYSLGLLPSMAPVIYFVYIYIYFPFLSCKEHYMFSDLISISVFNSFTI